MTFDYFVGRGGFWWLMNLHTTDVCRTDLTTTYTRGAFLKNYQRPICWQNSGNWSWFSELGGMNHELKFGLMSVWDKSFVEQFGYPNQQLYRYRSSAVDVVAG